MQYSDVALNLIKAFQPCHIDVYVNKDGDNCIGFEHKIGQIEYIMGNYEKITSTDPNEIINQATEWLREDLDKLSIQMSDLIYRGYFMFNPTQFEFDALISFAFDRGMEEFRKFILDRNNVVISSDMLGFTKNGRFTELIESQWRLAESILFRTNQIQDIPNTINIVSSVGLHYKVYTDQDRLDVINPDIESVLKGEAKPSTSNNTENSESSNDGSDDISTPEDSIDIEDVDLEDSGLNIGTE